MPRTLSGAGGTPPQAGYISFGPEWSSATSACSSEEQALVRGPFFRGHASPFLGQMAKHWHSCLSTSRILRCSKNYISIDPKQSPNTKLHACLRFALTKTCHGKCQKSTRCASPFSSATQRHHMTELCIKIWAVWQQRAQNRQAPGTRPGHILQPALFLSKRELLRGLYRHRPGCASDGGIGWAKIKI